MSSSILFVDSRVADYQSLLADLSADVDVHVLNAEQATVHHQELRKSYEEKLCTLLEMGVVNDFEQLKKFIAKERA